LNERLAPLKALAWLWTKSRVLNSVSPPGSIGAFQAAVVK
jgi:hypothetical protein